MTLRERQAELTRSTIIEAAADLLFGSEELRDFTMQDVAERAGVSPRTLYRYFGSRHELVNAVGAYFDERLGNPPGVTSRPETLEEWVEWIPAVVAFARSNAEIFRRAILLGLGTGQWRTDRDAYYWGLFRARFPHLTEDEARQDYAALRHLLWPGATIELEDRFGLGPADISTSLQRAARTIIADVDRRDRAAAEKLGTAPKEDE